MAENKLIIGNIEITGIQNITAGNQELSTSLLNDVLEIDTLDCDFNSEDSSINILSCIGEKVTYYHGDQQRQILYVESIKRTGPKSYHIYAVSAVSKLDTIPHSGGIYTGQTALEVISEICGPIPVIVKSNLRNIQLYGWLPYCQPPNSSARDNLNQVLFAIGASLGTDLNGVLRIETLWDGTTGAIELQRTDLNGSVTDVQKVSIVSVTEHQYTEGQEEQNLFEGTAQEGDTIVFNEPMHTLTASGFTILESGANYAKLSAGSGILTGKKYIHNKRVIARTVTENIPENEKSKENATLVSLINSNAIADRLARYYKCNKTIQASFITEYERPGQIVNIMDPYDQEIVSACIASMNVNMSGVLKADAELLVGFVPPKPETGYITERVVLTGSGRWKKPAGVTRIEYVLIGPGQGGRAGKKGEPGSATTLSFSYSLLGINTRYSGKHPGEGGKGGEGGAAGHGGKIYRGEMDLSVIDELEYSCGPGGTGATYDESNPEAEGNEGNATTLGDISSDLGSSSEFGYTDIITGEVYATTGLQGIAGGDGAGTTAEDRENSTAQDGFHFTPSTGVTDEDGTFWAGGTTKTKGNTEPPKLDGDGDQISFNGSLGDGYAGAEVSYALGSGAAAGAAGKDGIALGRFSVSRNSSKTTITARAYATNGLKGADAAIVPKKALNGNGGRGGYGGGGGSSIGAAGTFSGSDGSPVGSYNLSSTTADPGEGGLPSQGGEGGDGLIILYYSVPKETQNGPIMDRTGRFILDKLGRRFVV